jgi:EAL domain-containing protein (putative c-di-GMP-specific phosphodiesterase class I)
MLNRVAGMGIGIIQGYYYAKAIPLEEFKIFINSNTSIRYKSIVK